MNEEYTILKPWDWRYSAAIVGLNRYFEWLSNNKEIDWELTEDELKYRSEYVNESDYLRYVEAEYLEDMHHRVVEQILAEKEPTEEQIKLVNNKSGANTILKKLFKGIKYDSTNAQQIQDLIDINREDIIRETFRNKSNLYSNYANVNQLFQDTGECCRLVGYYIDIPKKGKSQGYNFDRSKFVYRDEQIFDFIPFAFCGERDFFFINDNLNLKQLVKTNDILKQKLKDARQEAKDDKKSLDSKFVFLTLLMESKDFIRSDVEVIVKNIEKDYFETIYLRRESLDIFNSLKNKSNKCFQLKFKITDNYWLEICSEVLNAIINLVLLDNVINYLLKNYAEYTYLIDRLVQLNVKIKGGMDMNKSMTVAFACAKSVAEKIPQNKLESYNQKLTSAIVFEDYDRFCQILLNLANFAEVDFSFAYDLFEDFEKNKEVAYTFVNALRKDNKVEK
jgi:CRISPR-associated protein Cst1